MAWEETVAVIKIDGEKRSEEWLRRVGDEAVETILVRTKSGKDRHGQPFHPYSQEYKSSDEFVLAGKSPGKVDLMLFGEMLADLSVLSARDNTIVIGFPDEHQRAKANGHITAKQGTGKLPKRDFLGISDDELKRILAKVPDPERLKRAREKAAKSGLGSVDELFKIIDNIGKAL